ncbi:unnamed protein product [Tenebrio molitor]|jgi:hypothetical protein|nr:unnamed protein product [Tenebrio molitor]
MKAVHDCKTISFVYPVDGDFSTEYTVCEKSVVI